MSKAETQMIPSPCKAIYETLSRKGGAVQFESHKSYGNWVISAGDDFPAPNILKQRLELVWEHVKTAVPHDFRKYVELALRHISKSELEALWREAKRDGYDLPDIPEIKTGAWIYSWKYSPKLAHNWKP